MERKICEECRGQIEKKEVNLYKEGKVSLGLGARLAGLILSEFIDLLREQQVTLNLTQEDVQEALETARKVL